MQADGQAGFDGRELATLEERARAKVRNARRGEGVGPLEEKSPWTLVPYALFVLFMFGALSVLALSILRVELERTDGNVGPAIALGVVVLGFGALGVAFGFKLWRELSPHSPEMAVRKFYRALARGRAHEAATMVLGSDFDDLPRRQPSIRHLGRGEIETVRFGDRGAFAKYWLPLLRYHTSPYCLVRFTRLRVEHVAPDVAMVSYRLHLAMNTSSWWLLIFISLPVAVIVDLATRKRVTADLSRMAVRVGDQWKLVSGAWAAPEELRADWLPPPPMGWTDPYRGADEP